MNTSAARLWAALLVAGLIMAGCGESEGASPAAGLGTGEGAAGTAGVAASFVDVQIALHASGCSEGGCHGPPDGQGGLELVDAPWENLVHAKVRGCDAALGRERVVPGRPADSYLLDKLLGTDLCGGVRMPKGCDDTVNQPCMKPERIAILESWILGGAERE